MPRCDKAPQGGALLRHHTLARGVPACRVGKNERLFLQRVAVRFERADALLELNDIRRSCEISLATATFSSFKPVAQLFDQKCNHDELQGSVKNPRRIGHQGFPVEGLTRIIALCCNLASELLEYGAFRFGMVHTVPRSKSLIQRDFLRVLPIIPASTD
jgi:hypothetical protein